MERRDIRTRYESSMEEYLEQYGYHFNKKLCDFAVGMMEDHGGHKLQPWDKETTNTFLSNNGITLKNNRGHDATYVVNMARADYFGSSIVTDAHLAKYVKDYLDDIDGSPSRAFDEFWIKMVALGEPVFWDEML